MPTILSRCWEWNPGPYMLGKCLILSYIWNLITVFFYDI